MPRPSAQLRAASVARRSEGRPARSPCPRTIPCGGRIPAHHGPGRSRPCCGGWSRRCRGRPRSPAPGELLVHVRLQLTAPALLREVDTKPVAGYEDAVVRGRGFGYGPGHVAAAEVMSGVPSARNKRMLLTVLPNMVENTSHPAMVGVDISIMREVPFGSGT